MAYKIIKPHMVRIILLLMTSCVIICVVLFNTINKRVDKRIRDDVTESNNNNEMNYQKCKIQELNPFHADALPFFSKDTPETCAIKKYGKLHDGILYLQVNNAQEIWLHYIRRIDDFKYKYSKGYTLVGNEGYETGNSKHFFFHLFINIMFLCFDFIDSLRLRLRFFLFHCWFDLLMKWPCIQCSFNLKKLFN